MMQNKVKNYWVRFWMRYAGLSSTGRAATCLASLFAPPHKSGRALAMMNPHGYIAPNAKVHHSNVFFGKNIFLGDRVLLFQAKNGGELRLGDRVAILRDTILETGEGGSITIGKESYIHPRCQINAYLEAINIGERVMIAANSAFYTHNHGTAPGEPIISQPLTSRGPIIIGDDVWIGTGVIVLGGISIGEGSVIGAGSLVTRNIPANSIAFGVPAKVIKNRGESA
jgi:acetyltransferase-like isoleucine patch superfamily enzyme